MYANMPADRRAYWLELLGIEGEVSEAFVGLAPGDEVIFVDDMYDSAD